MAAFRTDFQINAFCYILCAGFFISLLYDILLLFFRKQHIFLRLMADFFLTVSTAFLLFLCLYQANASSLRLYMLFAFALGALLYHVGIRNTYKFVLKRLQEKRNKGIRGE